MFKFKDTGEYLARLCTTKGSKFFHHFPKDISGIFEESASRIPYLDTPTDGAIRTTDTGAAVLTWPWSAELDALLTVMAVPPRLTIAAVLVDQLDTMQGARLLTRVREALVDVSFTPLAYIPSRTLAFEGSYQFPACSTMVAGTNETIHLVLLAEETSGSLRTRTLEVVDEVMAGSAIATWFRSTFIDIILTVNPLEAGRARGTAVAVLKVPTRRSVPARWGCTLVNISLAVWAIVPRLTYTGMRVANVPAGSFVGTEFGDRHTLMTGSSGTRHRADFAEGPAPPRRTVALEPIPDLLTCRSITTWTLTAPIDKILQRTKN